MFALKIMLFPIENFAVKHLLIPCLFYNYMAVHSMGVQTADPHAAAQWVQGCWTTLTGTEIMKQRVRGVDGASLLGAFKGCPAAEYTPLVRSFDMVSPQIARTRAV